MEKQEIRQQMRTERDQLNALQIKKWSQEICNQLFIYLSTQSFDQVIAYWPIQSEVNILSLLQVISETKDVFVLRSIDTLAKIDNTFLKSKQEPMTNWTDLQQLTSHWENLPVKELIGKTLVITPGLAFSKDGNRIGYGAGYFDHLFAHQELQFIKVGICFSFQLLDSLPHTEMDQRVDLIITENRN